MGKLIAAPVGNKWSKPNVVEEQEINLVTTQLAGGVNTYIDPADISDSQVQVANNYRIAGDIIFPRFGSNDTPFVAQGGSPHTKPILQVTRFARFDGTSIFTSFDEDKIYRRTSVSFDEVTGAGLTVSQRHRTLAANDRFFFASGTDPIQEIDFSTDTYADLGNASEYKYICSFADRIVGANRYGATTPPNNPIQVGWSGNLNYDEWSALVDPSAGNVALVEGQSDYSDEITGLFGFASTMLITRQRSLWIATKRPVASLPFQFTAAFPNVGCDSPDSIAQTKNGITWYDYRSNQVYTYEIGGSPVPIGFAIRKSLGPLVTDNKALQGSYDPRSNRYHLCVPSVTSNTSTVFVFDFETASWVTDTRYKVYGVFPIDSIATGLVYANAVGTYAEAIGTYDDFISVSISPSTIIYGLTDGNLLQDDSSDDTDNGQDIRSSLTSKVYQVSPKDISVSKLLFKLVPRRAGTVSFYFSRNSGTTWEQYKSISFNSNNIDRRENITCNKHITTDEFMWKLESFDGSFDLNEVRIQALQTTEVRSKI